MFVDSMRFLMSKGGRGIHIVHFLFIYYYFLYFFIFYIFLGYFLEQQQMEGIQDGHYGQRRLLFWRFDGPGGRQYVACLKKPLGRVALERISASN